MMCVRRLMLVLYLVNLLKTIHSFPECFEPDARVVSRWKNGNFYKGVIESLTNGINVLFDNGMKRSYNMRDTFDVIPDRIPEEREIRVGKRVVVNRPHSRAFQLAYIREIAGGRYMIWYEDGSYIYQTKDEIRVFNKSVVCDEPAYLGCFRDQLPRFLSVYIPTRPSTVGACVGICKAQGFSIAALRNSDLCFCGNSYSKAYQGNEKECDMPCYDNSYEMCGGVNTFSQYWTGIIDTKLYRPQGIYAPTKYYTDPNGYHKTYYTAIRKHAIPKFGTLPWRIIMAARNNMYGTPASHPWKWDPVSRSWVRKTENLQAWNAGTRRMLGRQLVNTVAWRGKPFTKNGWTWDGRSWWPDLRNTIPKHQKMPFKAVYKPPSNMRYDYGKRQYVSKYTDPRQYKVWRAPTRESPGNTQKQNTGIAKYFTPQRVLNKLAGLMDHVKWSQLNRFKSFEDAFRRIPEVPSTFRYLGCFADDFQHDLSVFLNVRPLTVRSCALKCRASGYSVAGVQSSWQCFCGNTYSRYGRVREHQCNMRCAGDRMEICGGELRNAIYYTGVGEAMPYQSQKAYRKKPYVKIHQKMSPRKEPKTAYTMYTAKENVSGLQKEMSSNDKLHHNDISENHTKQTTPKGYGRKQQKQRQFQSTKGKESTMNDATAVSRNVTLHHISANVSDTQPAKLKWHGDRKGMKYNVHHTHIQRKGKTESQKVKSEDDYEVESIKVRVNFSELKKALETFSPEIVKKVREDLAKMDRRNKKKHLLHKKKKLKVVLDETEDVQSTALEKDLKQMREHSKKLKGKIVDLAKSHQKLVKSGTILDTPIHPNRKHSKVYQDKKTRNGLNKRPQYSKKSHPSLHKNTTIKKQSNKNRETFISVHSSKHLLNRKKLLRSHEKSQTNIKMVSGELRVKQKGVQLSKKTNRSGLNVHKAKSTNKQHPRGKQTRLVNVGLSLTVAGQGTKNRVSTSNITIHAGKDNINVTETSNTISSQENQKQLQVDGSRGVLDLTSEGIKSGAIRISIASKTKQEHSKGEEGDVNAVENALRQPNGTNDGAKHSTAEDYGKVHPQKAEFTISDDKNTSTIHSNTSQVANKISDDYEISKDSKPEDASVESEPKKEQYKDTEPARNKEASKDGSSEEDFEDVVEEVEKYETSGSSETSASGADEKYNLPSVDGNGISSGEDVKSAESSGGFNDIAQVNKNSASTKPIDSFILKPVDNSKDGTVDHERKEGSSMDDTEGIPVMTNGAVFPSVNQTITSVKEHGSGAIEVEAEDNDTNYIYFGDIDKTKLPSVGNQAPHNSRKSTGAREAWISNDTVRGDSLKHPANDRTVNKNGNYTGNGKSQASVEHKHGNNTLIENHDIVTRSRIPSPSVYKKIWITNSKKKSNEKHNNKENVKISMKKSYLHRSPRKSSSSRKRITRMTKHGESLKVMLNKEGHPSSRLQFLQGYRNAKGNNVRVRYRKELQTIQNPGSKTMNINRLKKLHYISERLENASKGLHVKRGGKQKRSLKEEEEDDEGGGLVLLQRMQDYGARNEVVWRGSHLQERTKENDRN